MKRNTDVFTAINSATKKQIQTRIPVWLMSAADRSEAKEQKKKIKETQTRSHRWQIHIHKYGQRSRFCKIVKCVSNEPFNFNKKCCKLISSGSISRTLTLSYTHGHTVTRSHANKSFNERIKWRLFFHLKCSMNVFAAKNFFVFVFLLVLLLLVDHWFYLTILFVSLRLFSVLIRCLACIVLKVNISEAAHRNTAYSTIFCSQFSRTDLGKEWINMHARAITQMKCPYTGTQTVRHTEKHTHTLQHTNTYMHIRVFAEDKIKKKTPKLKQGMCRRQRVT